MDLGRATGWGDTAIWNWVWKWIWKDLDVVGENCNPDMVLGGDLEVDLEVVLEGSGSGSAGGSGTFSVLISCAFKS